MSHEIVVQWLDEGNGPGCRWYDGEGYYFLDEYKIAEGPYPSETDARSAAEAYFDMLDTECERVAEVIEDYDSDIYG